MDREEHDLIVTKLVVRSWQDEDFKQLLLNDPLKAMEEIGVPISDSKSDIVPIFVENTPQRKYFILPERPQNASLDEVDILAVMEEQNLVLPVCERS